MYLKMLIYEFFEDVFHSQDRAFRPRLLIFGIYICFSINIGCGRRETGETRQSLQMEIYK